MPTNINNRDKRIINNMRKGMFVESGKDKYNALNRNTGKEQNMLPTLAFGLYQFTPTSHLAKMKELVKSDGKIFGLKESDIPSVAEFEKVRDKAFARYKKTKNESEFDEVQKLLAPAMSNKAFQDSYYEKWMAEEIIPEARKTYAKYGRELGLSLESVIAGSHLLGTNGMKNKLASAIKNPEILDKPVDSLNTKSIKEYTNEFVQAIITNGGNVTHQDDLDGNGNDIVMTVKEQSDVFDELIEREKAINDSNISKENKVELINNLYDDIKTAGLTEHWNLHHNAIQQKANYASEKWNKGETPGSYIHKLINNPESKFEVDDKGQFSIIFSKKEYDKIKKSLSENQFDQFKTSSYKVFEKDPTKDKLYYTVTGNAKNLLEIPDKEYRDITGKNLYFDVNPLEYKEGPTPGITIKKNIKADGAIKVTNYKPVDFSGYIDKEEVRRRKNREDALKKIEDEKNQVDKKDSTKTKTEDEEVKAPTNNKIASDYFSDLKREETTLKESYDYKEDNFKKELPLEALAFGALALKGLGDAKTKLPEENIDVDEAIYQMQSELKRLSEVGLNPEEEAYMKDVILQNYNEGLNQATRASGGNRNIVLGASNNLNATRLQGLSNIALADIKRKDDMRKEYDNITRYIDTVHRGSKERKFDQRLEEAKTKRASGIALANSGFSSMLNEIQYQRENAPGSANHMAKQAALFKLHGYVPGMKGGENTVGTLEWKQKQEAVIRKDNERIKAFNETKERNRLVYEGMTPDQKATFEKRGGFQQWINEEHNYFNPKAPQRNLPAEHPFKVAEKPISMIPNEPPKQDVLLTNNWQSFTPEQIPVKDEDLYSSDEINYATTNWNK